MRRALGLLLFALLVGGALTVPAAQSASPDVVVSQVYAGGGNAGAPFVSDYVELSTFMHLSTIAGREVIDGTKIGL